MIVGTLTAAASTLELVTAGLFVAVDNAFGTGAPSGLVLVDVAPVELSRVAECGWGAMCSSIQDAAPPDGTHLRALTALGRTPFLDTVGTGEEALVEVVLLLLLVVAVSVACRERTM